MKITIICFVVLLVFACTNTKSPVAVETSNVLQNTITLNPAQFKNAGIVLGKIVNKEINTVLKLNGTIDVPPQNKICVSVPLGGYLKYSKLLPGMHMQKGEVIAIIEDQQYIQLQEDYLTAKAKIVYAAHEYNRQKDLNQNKASSDKVFQQAEAGFKSQQVLISALAEKLKLAGINPKNLSIANISSSVSIHSPINGFVSKANVNIGKYLAPTDVLFELIDPSDIHLSLKVYEKDLDKLYIGQKVVAYTNNELEKKHLGEILLIGKDLSSDRSTDVHCHFDAYDKKLVPGTYMNAEIKIKSIASLALPSAAIVQFNGKNFVFTSQGNSTFKMVEVITGENDNGFTALTLPQNETAKSDFVLEGAYALFMMLKNKQT